MMQSQLLAAVPGIVHGFFGREGGVSTGLYASLNVGLGSRDDPAAVAENRRRVAARLGVAGDHLVSLYQIHSAEAVVVTGPWPQRPVEADALVTRTPRLAVGALAADCAPVLLVDPVARVVAAAHAGWKGALTGIVDAAVVRMEGEGADRSRILAAIGPCIGAASYEVGPEFEARFVEADPANARWFACPPGRQRAHFDLGRYLEARLQGLGLGAVDRLDADTCADPARWFSYRRTTLAGEPDYGRQISAIAVT
ncbi:MAG: peptidoglycan editing factor PgeF [Alphaproteobacteria bacterium]|nr:peptidoglycan editing factor PgeF [Alphaproteobacteria bacterium]